MADELYDTDVLTWSERQAALLRRLAAGERVNDAVDWGNVIEEIETVGRSEWQACESLLIQAMAHLLKFYALPESLSSQHWQAGTAAFLGRAARYFTNSMRQRIEIQGLYEVALWEVTLFADGAGGSRPLPKVCPFTLDALLDRTARPVELAEMEGAAHG